MATTSIATATSPINNNKKPEIGLFPSPSRRARRNRCISCSENGNLDPNELLVVPEVIVTKRNRTESVSGRIEEDVERGAVKYFCRSRGHGFIVPEKDPSIEMFVHISDVEGEFVPRKGDTVSFRSCPIPPKFEKFQAVHVHIVSYAPGPHVRWESPETLEEREDENKLKSLPYDV